MARLRITEHHELAVISLNTVFYYIVSFKTAWAIVKLILKQN